MKYIVSIICALSSVFAAIPENAINVKAESELKFRPNVANFTFTLEQISPNADSSIIQIKPKIDAVEKIFKEYKLDGKSAVIKEMNISVNTEMNKDRERIQNGFKARRKYSIQLKDLEKLSDLVVDLKLIGVNEIGSIKFTHTALDSLEQIVMVSAIKKASQIGNRIASETGLKIGNAQIISNEQPEDFDYENQVNIDFSFGKGSGIGDMLGGLLGGIREEKLNNGSMEKINALKSFFKIEVEEIKVKNKVWVTFPILSKQ